VRKLIPAFAAWIAIWVIVPTSVASAQPQQQRGDGGGRARPQVVVPNAPRGGGFSGMLGEIAGARLDRAHADRRDRTERPARGQGPGGYGGGGRARGGF
jgi:hypothetical protein